MPYQPMPMYAQPAPQKVMVFGPLDQRMEPMTLPVPSKQDLVARPTTSGGVRQVQAESNGPPVMTRQEMTPEACGSDGDVGALCDPRIYQKPTRGRGRFIGEVGAYFLAPFSSSRFAFNMTTDGQTEAVDFPHALNAGARTSLGYMFHTGWGVRGNYGFLTGVASQSAVVNPGSDLRISSAYATINAPSFALNNGIGYDNFDFRQRFQAHFADIELIKEACFLDTTFLFGVGGRYGRITQSYTASRTNPGGPGAGLTSVTLDQEDQNSSSFFEGWGPTVVGEVVQPLCGGVSAYGSIRGAFLFGTDRFAQTYRNQIRSTDAAGVTTFTDTTAASTLFDHRYVSFVEPELGLQFGRRMCGCYVFARLGAVYQRWWDVGTPTTFGGSLNMVGGTFRLGIVY
jgi:hypothetical protein